MKTIEQLISTARTTRTVDKYLAEEFDRIIINKAEGYGKGKKALKSFFKDLQHGGCISGLIGEFIYNSDCKEFYIRHIDALKDFKQELEDELGEPIKNRHGVPHYVFMCWLCFEEYCFDAHNRLFES